MAGRVRIVIADDHAVLRAGLKAFLEEQTDPPIEVVAQTSHAEEVGELVERFRPDLLLLDLSMPGLGGLGVTIELRRRQIPVRILVLTQHAEAVYLRRAFDAGADGYIVKSARGEDLLSAIRAVMKGGKYIEPTLAAGFLSPGAQRQQEVPASDEEAYGRLTPRERQVLKLVAEGYTNKEIAVALDVAVKTAMAHRANLMDKLGIHNRAKLTQFAMRMGLSVG